MEEIWIGDKFWTLARNKDDIWHSKYIESMSYCRLRWEKKCNEYLKDIKESNKDESLNAWNRVILRADFIELEDRDALLNLLLHILESRDIYPKNIQLVALHRLNLIVSEIPEKFDEEMLNLPLSQRTKALFI